MSETVTRRRFLAASCATSVALAVGPGNVQAAPRATPDGPVYGRTGPRGIRSGSRSAPSLGPVTLEDGGVVRASHDTSWAIGPHRGVLLSPDGKGGWSILYAEV